MSAQNAQTAYAKSGVKTDVAKILNQHRTDYTQAMLAENTVALLNQYSTDTRLMPEANPTIFGKENAKHYFDSLFERFDIQSYKKSATDFIPIANKLIAESGAFELTMLNKQGQQKLVSGHYTNLWRKQAKGQWTIDTDIWNFNQWFDFKQELVFKNVPSVVTALGSRISLDNELAIELAAYEVLSKDAVLEGDPRVLIGVYAQDARQYPNYHPPVVGKKAIDDYWRKHIQQLPTFSMLQDRTDKAEEHGDYIIQHASHIAAYRTAEISGVSTGKHLRIWKRNATGRIKTLLSISAYDN
ncbi:DUF4440 domain-containing protein [Paraglaciecola aquimarina]|uniref:DUF4440 domain-containing protein n=1 Tax=Paraglaciecola algarum TaxID=3050085 RepID=A0ABS9D8Y4_9ALTE|nr:DUF4440 domain-containing protein [Paraglaciecola sp. G1-23]MCF2949426.1 DUF4440 domain-containing protein [Paraglaciecola sp. G1-23]